MRLISQKTFKVTDGRAWGNKDRLKLLMRTEVEVHKGSYEHKMSLLYPAHLKLSSIPPQKCAISSICFEQVQARTNIFYSR